MRIAIIGRSEILYDTAIKLLDEKHQIACILTAKAAPEYNRNAEDFSALAARLRIPFAEGSRIERHADFLRTVRADIAVSINYTGIVPQFIIDLFPLGVLNAHGGDLPRYRGNACQAWAILNGEDRIGLCVHRMIGGELDSGDIIARDYLAIDHTTKVTRVWEWMSLRTPELMLNAVQVLSDNPEYVLHQQSKDPKHALRCYPRKPEDGRIDWTKPAVEVLRLINASSKPYSGAFCNYEGATLIVLDAELVSDGEAFCAVPGQVTRVSNGTVEVACGDGKLRLLQLEAQGTAVSPSDLITSIRKRLR